MTSLNIAGLLHHGVWRCIGYLTFSRIRVIGKERLTLGGPVVFVATHRNGALDAAPYSLAVPLAMPMVSAQLQRLPLGRFLFRGIAVARAKDKARGIKADNGKALAECIELLKEGGQLFIMPEGTSSLGCRHLPFNRGAARIVAQAMAAGVTPIIQPLAVHYEDPTHWQSRVEVLIGAPIIPQNADEIAIHQSIVDGLEVVGANFVNSEDQQMAEKLAYARILGSDLSYAEHLKKLEGQIAPGLSESLRQLEAVAKDKGLFLHQGLPLMPLRLCQRDLVKWLLLAPVIACFSILNFPVLAAGHIASQLLPDEPNVIAFWRMVVGVPVGLFWVVTVCVGLFLCAGPSWFVLYGAISIVGVLAWYRFRKLTVALGNAVFHPEVRAVLVTAYRNLAERKAHE
ncbi:1-acyl-sn-glycerol-3-phosphate acyltransferase [Methylomonas sp. EFPC1]|uniref:1-acyl-sn-glycerol-3-phosphate acyltransferase n=1 Tax=Methylomonas sp. EFPC1 TaxID=2812647 RepID=UPI00196859C3|nr:1-acyl-sn-glycerol-3-phosphate acyltransferase [Methylomonas sp. EFPC1]QSB03110.1 1-acyl-sn-glycerol-3-phosphate acyltransferase [Methylomonas sp. EFPC1]